MSKKRKGKADKCRLSNCSVYNQSGVKRGSLAFIIIDNIEEFWLFPNGIVKLPGGHFVFSNKGINICLQIRELHKSDIILRKCINPIDYKVLAIKQNQILLAMVV